MRDNGWLRLKTNGNYLQRWELGEVSDVRNVIVWQIQMLKGDAAVELLDDLHKHTQMWHADAESDSFSIRCDKHLDVVSS